MVKTADAVRVLFPAAVPLIDFVVSSSGGVESITFWNPALGTQPTAEQLAAVTQAQVDAIENAKPLKKLRAQAQAALAALQTDATDAHNLATGSNNLTAAQLTTAVRGLAAGIERTDKILIHVIERLIEIG